MLSAIGKRQHEPESVAVGRARSATPRLVHLARPRPVTSGHRADPSRRSRLRRPMIASTSSSWPLPATPAMPRISPARTSKSTPWTTSWPRSSLTRRPVDVEHGLGRVDSPRSTVELRPRGRPSARPGRPRSSRTGCRCADDLAAPDDGDPVGDLEHLVQLVADEDDAVALLGEAPQDAEDLLGLLGRQDRGRLVEDEDLARRGRAP